VRPRSRPVNFPVTAQRKEPAAKNVNAVRSMGFRPKMLLRSAKSGRKQVATTRNAIPNQMVSKVEPPRRVAIVYWS